MRFVPTEIPDVVLIEPDVHRDVRGFFVETYRRDEFVAAGIDAAFVQDNHTKSAKGTLRGLHMQVVRPQGKLIRVTAGEIFDVAVDLRRGSPTFAKWVVATLSAENFRQCFIPAGFAHGFCVTSETAEVVYKCTELYDPRSEVGIAWDDPTLGIPWPVTQPILSDRDRRNPRLADIRLPE